MLKKLEILRHGIPPELPPHPGRDPSVPHAPRRHAELLAADREQALSNVLRYFPVALHAALSTEFVKELDDFGHIYCYRYRPTSFPMRAHPIDEMPARCRQAAAIQLMILNNLDPRVAQFPDELITYGGTGAVFGNWAQFWVTMKLLSEMSDTQTLVMCSGHPAGLFPSHADAPRAILSNGMVIPNYSSRQMFDKMYATGVTMYGQMTAGSYCYIGPQVCLCVCMCVACACTCVYA
jgi:urocanate hydratase